MTVPIKGQVAVILGPRELVINRGTHDGVWSGMRFAILDLRATEITDPATTDELGSIRLEKIRLKIVKTEPRVSLARTYELVPGGLNSRITNIQQLLGGSEPQYKTFAGEAAAWDETKSIVRRGDTVEQILEANHQVVDMVVVYESARLSKPASQVKAVVLVELEGTNRNPGYYPTSKEYHPGRHVTWEWDTNKRYGQMWRKGTKGEPLKAWDRSAEFSGQELTDDAEVAAPS